MNLHGNCSVCESTINVHYCSWTISETENISALKSVDIVYSRNSGVELGNNETSGRRKPGVKAQNGGEHGRALILKTHKNCRFVVNCICTHATGSRPPEHETCAHEAAAACIRMPR